MIVPRTGNVEDVIWPKAGYAAFDVSLCCDACVSTDMVAF